MTLERELKNKTFACNQTSSYLFLFIVMAVEIPYPTPSWMTFWYISSRDPVTGKIMICLKASNFKFHANFIPARFP